MSDSTLGWLVIGLLVSLPLAFAAVVSGLRSRGIWNAGRDEHGGGCGGG